MKIVEYLSLHLHSKGLVGVLWQHTPASPFLLRALMADICPLCKADLQGDEIPEEVQHMYSGTHFSRKIGYEIRGVYDGVLFWVCPDCDQAFHRWEIQDMRDRAQPYIDKFNAGDDPDE